MCFYGRIAQQVRASALQAGGHRFEPCSAYHFRLRTQADFSALSAVLRFVISLDGCFNILDFFFLIVYYCNTMETFIFDTLAYAEKLIAACMPEKQAKAFAEAQVEVLSSAVLSDIVTKTDLANGLKELEARIDIKMNNLEIRLAKWFAGFFIVQVGVTVGIVIAILKLIH